jgi:hypothetical protein
MFVWWGTHLKIIIKYYRVCVLCGGKVEWSYKSCDSVGISSSRRPECSAKVVLCRVLSF